MPSTALYTDTGRVCAALGFQSPETLQNAVVAGATSIVLNQTPPSDWQVGSQLVLDANNASLRETVTVTSVSGSTVSVSATSNAHAVGAPVVNGTIVSGYVSIASRWFDTVTWNRQGFAYETVTETKDARVDRRGYIVCPLSKPLVALSDITSATWQVSPIDPVISIDLTKAWVRDKFFFEVVAMLAGVSNTRAFQTMGVQGQLGLLTITYKGGYTTIPDDITNAVTVMAARFYKERDSGYSDAIGSADTGIITYKKAMPADVAATVQMYKRWVE